MNVRTARRNDVIVLPYPPHLENLRPDAVPLVIRPLADVFALEEATSISGGAQYG